MKFNVIKPKPGDVIIVTSDDWYVWDKYWDGESETFGWRAMSAEEQLEASK